jgi:hypothetical protein
MCRKSTQAHNATLATQQLQAATTVQHAKQGACHTLHSTRLHSAGSWPTRVGVAAVAADVHGVALCVGVMQGSLSGAPQVGLGKAARIAAKAAGSGCWSTGTARTHACTPRTKQQGAPAERKSKEEHT